MELKVPPIVRDTQLSEELARSTAVAEELRSSIDDIEGRHSEEIRLIRFELGTARFRYEERKKRDS